MTYVLNEKTDYELLTDVHNCKFGKWYDGKGKDSFGYTSAYKSVNELHYTIHD